jgi:hypothetical protein
MSTGVTTAMIDSGRYTNIEMDLENDIEREGGGGEIQRKGERQSIRSIRKQTRLPPSL